MAKASVFWDEDGEPWAVFVEGHVTDQHFLSCARSIAARSGVRVQGKILHAYMRDCGDESETPYEFCDGRLRGAIPVTCIKQPPMAD